jgi:hypothetical protein
VLDEIREAALGDDPGDGANEERRRGHRDERGRERDSWRLARVGADRGDAARDRGEEDDADVLEKRRVC